MKPEVRDPPEYMKRIQFTELCDEQTETRVKHACATKSKPCKIVKFAFGLWRGEELDELQNA